MAMCVHATEVIEAIRIHAPHLVLIESEWLSEIDGMKCALTEVGIGGPMWAIANPNVDSETVLWAAHHGIHVLVDGTVNSVDDFVERIQSLVFDAPAVNRLQSRARSTLAVAHDETDRKILSLLATGARNAMIADEVYLSVQTVKNRLSRMMKAAGATNRTELAMRFSASTSAD